VLIPEALYISYCQCWYLAERAWLYYRRRLKMQYVHAVAILRTGFLYLYSGENARPLIRGCPCSMLTMDGTRYGKVFMLGTGCRTCRHEEVSLVVKPSYWLPDVALALIDLCPRDRSMTTSSPHPIPQTRSTHGYSIRMNSRLQFYHDESFRAGADGLHATSLRNPPCFELLTHTLNTSSTTDQHKHVSP